MEDPRRWVELDYVVAIANSDEQKPKKSSPRSRPARPRIPLSIRACRNCRRRTVLFAIPCRCSVGPVGQFFEPQARHYLFGLELDATLPLFDLRESRGTQRVSRCSVNGPGCAGVFVYCGPPWLRQCAGRPGQHWLGRFAQGRASRPDFARRESDYCTCAATSEIIVNGDFINQPLKIQGVGGIEARLARADGDGTRAHLNAAGNGGRRVKSSVHVEAPERRSVRRKTPTTCCHELPLR